MLPLPTKFFVTSGKAVSKVSDLNSFDEALQNAGLAEQNIVSVSSVLPVGIKPVRRRDLPMGAITHCVLAQQRGGEGESISAGIAYGFRDDGHGGYKRSRSLLARACFRRSSPSRSETSCD